MDIKTALGAIESKQSSEAVRGQAESGDVKTSAEELAALLRRMSEASTREIEELVTAPKITRTAAKCRRSHSTRHCAIRGTEPTNYAANVHHRRRRKKTPSRFEIVR
jgi:hypothetical protein